MRACAICPVRVLVTGASGFVGGTLAGLLADAGHEVYGTHLSGGIGHAGVVPVRADLAASGLALPEGRFDAVVHLAGLTPLERSAARLERVNGDGALNLFGEVGSRTDLFVYVSGLGVFGDTGGRTITESTPQRPHTRFARIRAKAEGDIRKLSAKSSTAFCSAYLGDVYGSSGWFAEQVVSRLSSGRFRIPAGGRYLKSFVHVDDAASALAALATGENSEGQYIVADSNPCLFSDFVNYAADKLGVRRPGSVPAFLARALLGKDALTLLTTPTPASNTKISAIVKVGYPSYREGLDQVLSNSGLGGNASGS